MIRLLYSLCFYLALPLVFARLAWRALKEPEYARRWSERLARIPDAPSSSPVWVHAVSAGETIAVVPLVKALRKKYPSLEFVVTTMTPTGSERVRALLGDSVRHYYAPYDLPHVVGRFLNRIAPGMLILTDTELWPNILHACKARRIPVIQVNARLSSRSASRYQRVAPLTRQMLRSMTHVAVQSAAQGERFVSLGLPVERMTVTGSIKFDLSLPEEMERKAGAVKAKIGEGRTVLVAASTHEGEEALVLEAFERARESCPELFLLLVPRHPQRFDAVMELVRRMGLSCVRHSEGMQCTGDTSVMIGDTMGELMYFYGASQIAFVGGSLTPVGGHNLMEPAALGLPILMGPHRFNIEDISAVFLDAGALREVHGVEDLSALTIELCRDESKRAEMGKAAEAVMRENRGALTRTLAIVARTLEQAGRTLREGENAR